MYIKIHLYLLLFMAYVFYQGKIEVFFWFYVSTFIHEVAHIVTALLLEVEVKEILFMPFGVNAKYQKTSDTWKEVLIYVAGPLMSFYLAFFSKDLFLRKVNLVVGILNLLPIYPLDGGRIQKCFWEALFGIKKGNQICSAITKLWIGIFWLGGLYFSFRYRNYYVFFLSVFLCFLSRTELKKERISHVINYLQIAEKCIK